MGKFPCQSHNFQMSVIYVCLISAWEDFESTMQIIPTVQLELALRKFGQFLFKGLEMTLQLTIARACVTFGDYS